MLVTYHTNVLLANTLLSPQEKGLKFIAGCVFIVHACILLHRNTSRYMYILQSSNIKILRVCLSVRPGTEMGVVFR